MSDTKIGKTECKAWARFKSCLLTSAGNTGGVINDLIVRIKPEKNLLRSIQSDMVWGFFFILWQVTCPAPLAQNQTCPGLLALPKEGSHRCLHLGKGLAFSGAGQQYCCAGWDKGLWASPGSNREQSHRFKLPHLWKKGANSTLHGKSQCWF